MKAFSVVFAVLVLFFTGPAVAEPTPGRVTGGEQYSLPDWFLKGFPDIRDNVDEARKQGKHIMVFVHLRECPYCARMLKDSFTHGENREFMQKHFDVIGVSKTADVEITWIDGKTYKEKALASHLKAVATPTIIFLDLDGRVVLRLPGYRDPTAFRYALEYVQSKTYRNQPYTAYVAAQKKKAVYGFHDHPQLSNTTYFKDYVKPLAILFEDKYCGECARFHETTLKHPDVVKELKPFLFVRLDTDSKQTIIGLDGKATTAAKWAASFNLSYRPAMVLFNEGRERFRADGRLYQHHLKEVLHYVSGAYYNKFDSMGEFKAFYRNELMNNGFDVNFAE